jgi:hypothetical protein
MDRFGLSLVEILKSCARKNFEIVGSKLKIPRIFKQPLFFKDRIRIRKIVV